MSSISPVLLIIILKSFYSNSYPCNLKSTSNELRISNRCPYTVWPVIKSYSGSESLEDGDFELKSWDTKVIKVSNKWIGKVWGRSGCGYSEDGTLFICDTGDCGKKISCRNASSGTSPITVAEMAYGVSYGNEVRDHYSVNMIEGYNLQIQIRPVLGHFIKLTNQRFDCNLAGCFKDLNSICPECLSYRSQRSGSVTGCKNPCSKYYDTNANENDTVAQLYKMCTKNFISSIYFSIVQESCPDVTVFANKNLEGEGRLYKQSYYYCRKNMDGFSTYEVIFCP